MDEQGWVRIERADWRDDAKFAMRPAPILRPAGATRLIAIATVRKEVTAAVQDTKGTRTNHSQFFGNHVSAEFDGFAEAKLKTGGAGGSPKTYDRWLRSKCLPAVVASASFISRCDMYLNEVYSPSDLVRARQARPISGFLPR